MTNLLYSKCLRICSSWRVADSKLEIDGQFGITFTSAYPTVSMQSNDAVNGLCKSMRKSRPRKILNLNSSLAHQLFETAAQVVGFPGNTLASTMSRKEVN